MENIPYPSNPAQKKITVYARGDTSNWLFLIYEGDRLIVSDLGSLPRNYSFTEETANLYALAQAHRYITNNIPRSRVVLACTAKRYRKG